MPGTSRPGRSDPAKRPEPVARVRGRWHATYAGGTRPTPVARAPGRWCGPYAGGADPAGRKRQPSPPPTLARVPVHRCSRPSSMATVAPRNAEPPSHSSPEWTVVAQTDTHSRPTVGEDDDRLHDEAPAPAPHGRHWRTALPPRLQGTVASTGATFGNGRLATTVPRPPATRGSPGTRSPVATTYGSTVDPLGEALYNPTACGLSMGDVRLRARIGEAAVESPIAILVGRRGRATEEEPL